MVLTRSAVDLGTDEGAVKPEITAVPARPCLGANPRIEQNAIALEAIFVVLLWGHQAMEGTAGQVHPKKQYAALCQGSKE